MEEIYAILEENRPEFNYRESEDFIEDGMLDSFDIITIISMIEEKYSISIDPLDIVPENFSSAEGIYSLVQKAGGK